VVFVLQNSGEKYRNAKLSNSIIINIKGIFIFTVKDFMFKKILLIGALFGIAASSLTVAYDISYFDSSKNMAAVGSTDSTFFFQGYDSTTSTGGPRVTLVWNFGYVVSSRYTIERLKAGESRWQQLGATTNTYYYDTTAQPGVSYTYRISFQRATSMGSTDVRSQPVSVKLPTARGAVATPTNLSASYDSATRKVTFRWLDNSTNETAFEIQQNLNGRGWTTVGGNTQYIGTPVEPPPFATVGKNITTYSYTLPSSGSVYTSAEFRVRAFNPSLLAQGVTGFAYSSGNVFSLLAYDEYHVELGLIAYMTDQLTLITEKLSGVHMGEFVGDAISKSLSVAESRGFVQMPRTTPSSGAVQVLAQTDSSTGGSSGGSANCPEGNPGVPIDEVTDKLWNSLRDSFKAEVENSVDFDPNGDGTTSAEEVAQELINTLRSLINNQIEAGAIDPSVSRMFEDFAQRFISKKKFSAFGLPALLKEQRLFDDAIDAFNAFDDLLKSITPYPMSKDGIQKRLQELDKNQDGKLGCDETKDYLDNLTDKGKKVADAMSKMVKNAEGLPGFGGQGSGSGSGSGAPQGSGSGS
jgi:hypothetical protein